MLDPVIIWPTPSPPSFHGDDLKAVYSDVLVSSMYERDSLRAVKHSELAVFRSYLPQCLEAERVNSTYRHLGRVKCPAAEVLLYARLELVGRPYGECERSYGGRAYTVACHHLDGPPAYGLGLAGTVAGRYRQVSLAAVYRLELVLGRHEFAHACTRCGCIKKRAGAPVPVLVRPAAARIPAGGTATGRTPGIAHMAVRVFRDPVETARGQTPHGRGTCGLKCQQLRLMPGSGPEFLAAGRRPHRRIRPPPPCRGSCAHRTSPPAGAVRRICRRPGSRVAPRRQG